MQFISLGLWICGLSSLMMTETSGRREINPKNFKPHGRPYSSAIQAGTTVYVSGQGSQDTDGKQPEGFEAQVKQCLNNLRSILEGGGLNLDNVVWMHVYLTDLKDYPVMNKVYWETMGENPPARTVLGIADLPAGNKIEINCIAVTNATPKKQVWPTGFPRRSDMDPPGILAGDVLYLSAQGSRDPRTGRQPEGFSHQIKQALENVGEVLRTAGLSFNNAVWVNPYMDKSIPYEDMNKVYATYFEFGNTPGRGTINVLQLPEGDPIVFSCIAGSDLSKRKAIKPRNMPPSPTASPGVLYGDTFYVSAKSGFIPGQGIVTPDMELQLRQTMRNLLDGLEEADMDFSDVVWSTVYLKDMKNYGKMNDLYRTFFRDGYPARTTLQQSFDKETKTEEQISFIAVRGEK